MILRFLTSVLTVIVLVSGLSSAATAHMPSRQAAYASVWHLGNGSTYQNVILTASDESSTVQQNHIQRVFFDGSTRRVVILADPEKFEREAKTFEQFRGRYAAYWPLYVVMFALTFRWVP